MFAKCLVIERLPKIVEQLNKIHDCAVESGK
jgi:hypothetical protein